jgi:hypothetical protein
VRLDAAFKEEFGIELTVLGKLIRALIENGFPDGVATVVREESEMIRVIQNALPNLSRDVIIMCLKKLSLLTRKRLGGKQGSYDQHEIYPWRYSRQLSYLRRPFVTVKDDNDQLIYYFGYRHLSVFLENLYSILYNGKYPNPSSNLLRTWLAGRASDKGAPFRLSVKDWFKANTGLMVVDYEVDISPGGHLNADRDYGDIDILLIDHVLRRIYSVECKNITGGRNIYEMWSEIDEYLGDGEPSGNSKIDKHFRRHQWLENNKSALAKFMNNPETYEIRSLVVTADEIPLTYLKKQDVPLPIRSFPYIRQNGIDFLSQL